MNTLGYLKSYKQNLPEYSNWSKSQDTNYAKRLEYLRQHPEQMDANDVQRGKILLHAIDMIDEYSQSNAEDTEVATQMAVGEVLGFGQMLGTIAGLSLAGTKVVQNIFSKIIVKPEYRIIALNGIPSVAGLIIGTAATFPAIILGTKLKVSASRRGRFEAMNKDLKNPAIFAVLTPEQQKKVDELSKDIKLDDKEQKRLDKTKSMGLNPFDAFKTLKKMYVGEAEYKIQKKNFDDKLKQNSIRIGTVLPNDCIRAAKRDKQILSDMVRKIDIASQDYAENTELVTNSITTLALGSGALFGWVSNKLIKSLNITAGTKAAKFIPWFVGFSIPLGFSMYFAKIQKQASRIGRFKIKQEMLNNAESLVYVDDKKLDSLKGYKESDLYKKTNIIDFAKSLFKDYKDYTQYVKDVAPKELKRHKAIENLELSQEQLKEAKRLQMNLFKTFNKVDEKSQAYSEHIEAIGNIFTQAFNFVYSIGAVGFTIVNMFKVRKTAKNPEEMMGKTISVAIKTALFSLIPLIGIDVLTTKTQKKASRVADMLALKEMSDYRNYVDYTEFDSKFLQNK